MSDDWGPGTNSGHGHVWKRPDGMKARCGGPDMCRSCMADAAALAGRIGAERVPALRWEAQAWRGLALWAGHSGAAWIASVWRDNGCGVWRWSLVAVRDPEDVPAGLSGAAPTPDAAEAAAEAAWAAWCERAGLVVRVGIVPPYKTTESDAQGKPAGEVRRLRVALLDALTVFDIGEGCRFRDAYRDVIARAQDAMAREATPDADAARRPERTGPERGDAGGAP